MLKSTILSPIMEDQMKKAFENKLGNWDSIQVGKMGTNTWGYWGGLRVKLLS